MKIRENCDILFFLLVFYSIYVLVFLSFADALALIDVWVYFIAKTSWYEFQIFKSNNFLSYKGR